MAKVSRGKSSPAARAKPPAAQPKASKPSKSGKTESKGGSTQVRGTPKADNVKISQSQGKVQVEADRFVVDNQQVGAAKTIGVNTKRGRDRVQIDNVKSQDQSLRLKTGLGRDQVDVTRSEDLGVRTGKGRDRVSIQDSIGLDVRTGRGADRVEDEGSRDLDIRTGRGRDQAVLRGTQDSKLRMGKHRDHATLHDVNNVHVKGARTQVHTTETAKNRGRAEASAAAQNMRAQLENKIADQNASGKIRASLEKDGTLSVKGGKGRDNVTLSQQDGKITVRSGDRELASFNAKEVKAVDIRTGRGKDQVNLENIDAGKVRVRTGRGADEVNLVGSKNVNVRTGRGKDQVHSAQNENLRIRTGQGRDAVADTASQNLRVKTGRGRDQIQMTETLDSKVNGGKGKDLTTLTDVDNVKTRRTQVQAFTTPPPVVDPPPVADPPPPKEPEITAPKVPEEPPPVEPRPEIVSPPDVVSPPSVPEIEDDCAVEDEAEDDISLGSTDEVGDDSYGSESVTSGEVLGYVQGETAGSDVQSSEAFAQMSQGNAESTYGRYAAAAHSYGREAISQRGVNPIDSDLVSDTEV